jgi:hypothetical protein
MRCQHVDDDIQCRMDATRRVFVASGDPPDPDQSEFAGTIYMVMVCMQHDPDPRRSMPLPRPPGSVPIGERPEAVGRTSHASEDDAPSPSLLRDQGPYQFTKCATRSACRISR